MRRLTDTDLTSIAGSTVESYHVEGVRIKRGTFSDSDHYGYILGRSSSGHYVCWQFHLDESEKPNVYWGNYFMENREAAIRDYDTRDLDIDKLDVWNRYLRYLRDWADSHQEPGFYGTTPSCFDEWFSAEYQADDGESQSQESQSYRVTITETLKLAVEVEAGNRDEAEQIVSDNWRNSDYILDADNFHGVEFTAIPVDESTKNDDSYQCCLCETPRTFSWCEKNCDRYYSCDTVAWAGDKSNDE